MQVYCSLKVLHWHPQAQQMVAKTQSMLTWKAQFCKQQGNPDSMPTVCSAVPQHLASECLLVFTSLLVTLDSKLRNSKKNCHQRALAWSITQNPLVASTKKKHYTIKNVLVYIEHKDEDSPLRQVCGCSVFLALLCYYSVKKKKKNKDKTKPNTTSTTKPLQQTNQPPIILTCVTQARPFLVIPIEN